MSDPIRTLISVQQLPEDYEEVVVRYWRPLADALARRKKPGRPLLVGINGAQGSGKTTMCRFLQSLLAERGLRAVILSLDDFYLTRAERQAKALAVHPLFATRGVPGTHDIALARSILDGLLAGRSVGLPRFDKGADDRIMTTYEVEPPVDIVLFEGWCVGASPQSEEALAEPVNALEATEDAEGTWRRAVNRHLAEEYAGLFRRLDLLVMLAVPDLESVRANRHLQEQKLAQVEPQGAGVMDDAALERFIQHYERLTRHVLSEMPGRADIVFRIGRDQRPVALPENLANRAPPA